MNGIRVAIVTDFPHDPGDPCGGVQSVSVHLVQGLCNLNGLDLHVVTEDVECSKPEETAWGKVQIHRLPRRGKATFTNAIGPGRRQMIRYLKELAPDVIHAHDVYGLMVNTSCFYHSRSDIQRYSGFRRSVSPITILVVETDRVNWLG